ncbi:hypothetical protein [Aeromonas hydrophila]|uniref:hypothetical protein n=1 Tax=Aeromonas hydrophila TaxID=644 RepID=UPI0030DC143B
MSPPQRGIANSGGKSGIRLNINKVENASNHQAKPSIPPQMTAQIALLWRQEVLFRSWLPFRIIIHLLNEQCALMNVRYCALLACCLPLASHAEIVAPYQLDAGKVVFKPDGNQAGIPLAGAVPTDFDVTYRNNDFSIAHSQWALFLSCPTTA